MGAFVGLCCWAYGPSRRARFEEDGRLPFRDEEGDEG
jgi:cytochrome c oxidase cbb3-type subunit 4